MLDDLAVDSSLIEDRAGRYARSLPRERYGRYLRDYWARLLVFFLVAIGIGGFVVLVPIWMRGFLLGIWIASVVWFILSLVFQVSGASMAAMGATAEEWTAHEMRRLRREGWKVTSHVKPWAYGGDIDHLAVGPGGAVVIETKWVSDPKALERSDRVEDDRERMVKGLRRIRNSLRVPLQDAPIFSAIVYWGADKQVDDIVNTPTDKTRVLSGDDLRPWLESVAQTPALLTDNDVKYAWDTITDFVQKTDLQEAGKPHEAKPTWVRRLLDLLVGPFAGVITLWIAALLLRWLNVVALLPVAGLFAVGALSFHKSALATTRRRIGIGVMTAAIGVVITVAMLYLGSSLFNF